MVRIVGMNIWRKFWYTLWVFLSFTIHPILLSLSAFALLFFMFTMIYAFLSIFSISHRFTRQNHISTFFFLLSSFFFLLSSFFFLLSPLSVISSTPETIFRLCSYDDDDDQHYKFYWTTPWICDEEMGWVHMWDAVCSCCNVVLLCVV